MSEQVEQIVETIVLDFTPNGDLADDLRALTKAWDLEVILIEPSLAGWAVKYRGYESVLRLFLIDQYGSNEVQGSRELEWYIDTLLGNKLSEHRWSTGCTIGLNGTDMVQVDEDRFMWDHHWHEAGVGPHRDNTRYDMATDAAIDALAKDGWDNPDDPKVDRAQSYLALAALSLNSLNVVDTMKLPRNPDSVVDPPAYVVVDGNAYYIEERDEGVPVVMHGPVSSGGQPLWAEGGESEVMPPAQHTLIGTLTAFLFEQFRNHHEENC